MSRVGSASLRGWSEPVNNLGVGCVSIPQNSCGPLLNSRRFELLANTQTKAIHHSQDTTPPRHRMIILALDLAFCKTRRRVLAMESRATYLRPKRAFKLEDIDCGLT